MPCSGRPSGDAVTCEYIESGSSVSVGTIIWVIAGFADHLSEAPLSAIYLARLLLDFLEALALVSIVNLFYGLSVQSCVSKYFNKKQEVGCFSFEENAEEQARRYRQVN